MPVRAMLPSEPFIAWAGRLGLEVDLGGVGTSVGMSDGTLGRAVRRARYETRAVTLGMVDRFFTAAEQPHMLAILYPQDINSMEDRYCSTCVELVTVGDDRLCPWCETPVDEPPRRAALGAWPACATAQAAAKELRAAGLSYGAIASRLGVARSTAHGYVNAVAS